MKKLLLLFLLISSSVLADVCSGEEDVYAYAKFWDNYYDPEEAYYMGIKIQNLVAEEDLSGIFSLVVGELEYGPKKDFVKNKAFGEVFDEKWKAAVLEDKPSCRPLGWRGFMLGHGNTTIWFTTSDKTDSGWQIFSIGGAKTGQ
jgi:hypothetical protein